MKPAHARHRTDTGSAALIDLLVASGIGYVPLGGAIDGAAYIGNMVALVDWKAGATSKRTKTQIALVAKGTPIWFLASDEDVRRLVWWLRAAQSAPCARLTSAKKAASSRANGAKGGRPKRRPAVRWYPCAKCGLNVEHDGPTCPFDGEAP